MKVEKENLAKSKVKLSIVVEPKELAQYFRATFDRLASGVKIDGFRSGKAPYQMVVGAVGYNRLLAEGLDEALGQSYNQAIAESKIQPLSGPKVEIKKSPQFALDETEILDNLVYEITVDIMPEVKLKDYTKAKITTPKKQEASEKEVEKILSQLRKQKATFSDRTDKVKKGDRVEINFEGFLKGVKIDKMCSKNHPLVLGEGNMIPGFEDEIVGMKKGEEKEFKIKFPKDYHEKEYTGKEAKFKVVLNDAKEVLLPKLDDKFAENFGHKTMKKLNSEIKKSLEVEINKDHKNKIETLVLDKMINYIETEIPGSLVEQEIDRIVEGYKKQIEGYGLKFEKYLENSKKDLAQLRKEVQPQAEKNIKIGLLLGKIIEEQKIDHHDSEAAGKALDYLTKKLTK